MIGARGERIPLEVLNYGSSNNRFSTTAKSGKNSSPYYRQKWTLLVDNGSISDKSYRGSDGAINSKGSEVNKGNVKVSGFLFSQRSKTRHQGRRS